MIRIGFIGTGNFARQHAEVLKQLGADIVGCYGTNKEKTQAFSKDFECQEFKNSLDLISPEIIDALYIVIPPFAHDGIPELKAIENKIPFFCEKPVGLNLQICNEISEKIQSTNLITSSGYLLRYESLFKEVKEIINRNRISTIRICSYSHMPEVHWWRKEKLSGGMMVESGSHYIDLLRFFFGDIIEVASVNSAGISNKNVYNCDMYDSMESILKFQKGYIASIGITHLLNNIQGRSDELQIYGQDFVLKIDLYKLRYKNIGECFFKEASDTDWNIITSPTSKKDLLKLESVAFINAIKENNISYIKSTYPDAVQTLKIALAMNQSAKNCNFSYFAE